MNRLRLKVPFRTADSVVLVWDKQAPDIRYDIEVNGEFRESCACTDGRSVSERNHGVSVAGVVCPYSILQ